jgi:MFS family permease
LGVHGSASDGGVGHSRERRTVARQVQIEGGAFGILKSLNDAFVNPLLISRGAGPLALGVYNSGANLFGFGSGWLGPRFAAHAGSVRRMTLIGLVFGRIAFLTLALLILYLPDLSASMLIPLMFAWGIGEGIVLPLWAGFIAGMVGPGERGRWLAMRATAATLSTVPIMATIVLLFFFASKEDALPLAYLTAAIAGLVSLGMVARLLRSTAEERVPPARSLRALPNEPGARQFLFGVWLFWFGAAIVWPVLPAYIINDLDAPTAYFAAAQLMAALCGVFVQRHWGRLGDNRGATRMLLLSGIGASIVAALWGVIPYYWIGFAVEAIASLSWPGHMLGLTLRSVELAEHETDRSAMLGWTNLAQGSGACISPLIASWLVSHTGVVALLFVSATLRLSGTVVMTRPTSTHSDVAVAPAG